MHSNVYHSVHFFYGAEFVLSNKTMVNASQLGFREGKTCLSALLSVYDDLMLVFTGKFVVST